MPKDPYIIEGVGPSDLLTSSIEGIRRVKTSSEPSFAASVCDGLAFSVSGSFSVADGTKLAMNFSPASDVQIVRASTNNGLPISVYSEASTGTADGIFEAKNLNLCSVDQSPASAQLFSAATPSGSKLFGGVTAIEPYIYTCEGAPASVVVENNTGATEEVEITMLFVELGPRNPSFGLTATTQIEANTEMSAYG